MKNSLTRPNSACIDARVRDLSGYGVAGKSNSMSIAVADNPWWRDHILEKLEDGVSSTLRLSWDVKETLLAV